MKMIITNPGRDFEERPVHFTNNPRGPIATVTAEEDQTMLGFGAALTDGACIMLNKLPEKVRKELMHQLFSPEEFNINVSRICVGSSDYAAVQYHFAPVEDDMEMKYFDASHDDTDIIPILQEALAENPDLYLYSSPWSPPGWMKTSKVMQGGWMRQKYVDAYVLYYYKFLKYYLEKGVKISALTPQNESETDQIGRMPACLWHPEIEMDFAKKLRKLLDADEDLKDTKIWLVDHNFIMWHRAVFQYEDPETREAIAGFAWHPYEGYPEQAGYVHRLFPEAENHWTEGDSLVSELGPNWHGDWGSITVGGYAKCYLAGINNGMQSITLWNMALDENGYPNIGPFGCKGSVEILHDGSSYSIAKDLKALVHFSKYIQRGAKRLIVDKTGVPANFALSAFRNPDGTVVVVVANTDSYDSELNLVIDGKTVGLWILRESVNTILL